MSIEDRIVKDVLLELQGASKSFGNFHNSHEGYAVLKEEVDELWDEIKSKTGTRAHCYKEAIQVAAMAVRFVRDICPECVPGEPR